MRKNKKREKVLVHACGRGGLNNKVTGSQRKKEVREGDP